MIKINTRIRKYLAGAVVALMIISVAVLADVIYYYKGQITAVASQSPLTFCPGPNGYVPGYVIATPTPTGFNLWINITNASYAYYYQVLGIGANTQCWLYVANVTTSGSEAINNLVLYITGPSGTCVLPALSGGAPTTTSIPVYQSCTIGYWKTHATVPPWSGQYPPNDTLSSLFIALSQTCTELNNYTLLQALSFPSQGPYSPSTYCGKVELLLAQAVAALENSLTMNYPLTTQQIINDVNSAILSNNSTEVLNLQTYLNNLNEEWDMYCSPGTYIYAINVTSTTACPVTPATCGTYQVSVLVQPYTPLYTGETETVTLYLACNAVSNATAPLPSIPG